MWVQDFPDKKVYPKDCVPENRPKGSWTNGVEAWEKGSQGSGDTCVGWFAPPRRRNKGWLRWSAARRRYVPRPMRTARSEAEEE
tara:strand:+ start:537 stop:788 length:252 start_codon:yes stop_codon:yes gene_type:complete